MSEYRTSPKEQKETEEMAKPLMRLGTLANDWIRMFNKASQPGHSDDAAAADAGMWVFLTQGLWQGTALEHM